MLALALIFALLAAGSAYLYLSRLSTAGNRDQGMVVIASREIPARTSISRSMVREVKRPLACILPGAARSLSQVVGRVAEERILPGEEVLFDRLARPGDGKSGLAYQIPDGLRAVSVGVDEVTAVGWNLTPGDRVDVLAVLDLPEAGSTSVTISNLVVQDVLVLAVGGAASSSSTGLGGKKGEVKTITLAVTPDEAKSLLMADVKGELRLALRPVLDRGRASTAPLQLSALASVPR